MGTSLRYYLAVDIGASGGRHILGWLEDGVIKLKEVHRFRNGMENRGGSLCWDTDAIFAEVLSGMSKCADAGMVPASAGIDTWGVDFVLIDKDGNPAAPAVAYRDRRTEGMQEEVFKRVPEAELYARTGIQNQIFNTIFQLMAVKTATPHFFENASHLLLMPDYLHFRLCGARKTEYTIATTTGLVNAASGVWDDEVIAACGFPRGLFCDIAPAGARLGSLTDEVRGIVGYDCAVTLPPSHDTGSAFLAVPAKSENSVYISSGTWSLMGVELAEPITSEAGRMANFTNEGGFERRYRFLKNIMGLWMIQSVHKELGDGIGYGELAELARASDYPGTVDVGDSRFFAPDSMAAVVREVCREGGFAQPDTLGGLARCICRSLASSYAVTVGELETLTGKKFDSINIIGGGSKNMFLNELTAEACGLPVYAGPAEGTALGNIVSQMISYGELAGAQAARETIRRSFEIDEVRGNFNENR